MIFPVLKKWAVVWFFPLAAWLCGLRNIYLGFCAAFAGLSFLLIKKHEERTIREHKKLTDGIFYMEQLVVSFRKNRKIVTSLGDVKLFLDGEMEQQVDYALRRLGIEKGNPGTFLEENDEGNMFRDAFSGIESYCGSPLMHNLHTFLINVEEQGGDAEQALSLLGNQIAVCKKEENLFYGKMEALKKKLILSCILSSVILISVTAIMPDWVNLLENRICRTTLMVGFLVLQAFYLLFRCQKNSGLTEAFRVQEEEEETLKQNQKGFHFPSYQLREKKKKELVEKYFPVWMYEVLLRLQTESINSCILHSIDSVHPVLSEPLYRLYSAIEENPVSPDPYRDFLKEYDNEQIRSMMLQLFAVNAMGKEEIYRQIELLLEQNQAMKELKDEEMAESIIASKGFLAALPMFAGFAVMVIHMTAMLFSVLGSFSLKGISAGGI